MYQLCVQFITIAARIEWLRKGSINKKKNMKWKNNRHTYSYSNSNIWIVPYSGTLSLKHDVHMYQLRVPRWLAKFILDTFIDSINRRFVERISMSDSTYALVDFHKAILRRPAALAIEESINGSDLCGQHWRFTAVHHIHSRLLRAALLLHGASWCLAWWGGGGTCCKRGGRGCKVKVQNFNCKLIRWECIGNWQMAIEKWPKAKAAGDSRSQRKRRERKENRKKEQ